MYKKNDSIDDEVVGYVNPYKLKLKKGDAKEIVK